MATQIEILRVLKILGELYPAFQLSSSAVEVYVQLLADIPAPVLEKAALEHIGRSTFFPAIAELRSAAFDILESANPTPTDYEAWAEVQAEIRRVGHCEKPSFKNPLVKQVVIQLGWRYLCLSENPVADRAHFVQAYQALAERQRQDIRRPQLVTQFITSLKENNPKQLISGKTDKE